jgi:multiple sugar transport system permease protein
MTGDVLTRATAPVTPKDRPRKRRTRKPFTPGRVATWIGLFGLAGVIGFPVYFMVLTSLRSPRDIYREPSLIPGALTINNYVDVLVEREFYLNLLNSFLVASVTTIISVVLGVLAAYAISRLNFAGRGLAGASVLYSYLTPVVLLFVPLAVMVSLLNLGNTLPGLMLIYLTFTLPLSTWLILGYFRTFPASLEEAALLDGASRMRILWSILLPVSAPGVATAAVLTFTMAWNELFLALVFATGPDVRTAPVALQFLITGDVQRYGPIMAGAVLASIPVIVLYYYSQRWVVEGLGAGAVKG